MDKKKDIIIFEVCLDLGSFECIGLFFLQHKKQQEYELALLQWLVSVFLF